MKSRQVNLCAVLFLMLFGIANTAIAAQFESVISALGISESKDQTFNGWESATKIKGIKWNWPYYESGSHDSTMVGETKVGKDKNPNIGATVVSIEGSRNGMNSVHVAISNEGPDASEDGVFSLFGKARLKKITSSCDEDSMQNSFVMYEYNKQGLKPLYVSVLSSSGAGGSSNVNAIVTYDLEYLIFETCKVDSKQGN